MGPQRLVSIHRELNPDFRAARDRVVKRDRPTPENPMIISASEVRDFLRCRVKWYWRHILRIEPKQRSENLSIGTMVHAILETWYRKSSRSRKSMEKIAKKMVGDTSIEQLSTENMELVYAMCVGYAHWAKENDPEIGLEVCEPEEWFELPLDKERTILFRGRIDNRFKPTNLKKTMDCCEFKTAGQFRDKQLDTLTQVSAYLWAMRVKYPKVKRFRAHYTELRKQLPGPRVKAELFRRETVERSDEEIEMWVEDMRRTALDMLDAAIYPNPTDGCAWDCDYRNPCLLRGSPEDLEHVLQTQYQIKERRP